jgi:hypothetical protein
LAVCLVTRDAEGRVLWRGVVFTVCCVSVTACALGVI